MSPDLIKVNDIKLSSKNKDAISISLISNEIHIFEGVHPQLYRWYKIEREGFDFRIWTNSKSCSFWPCGNCFKLLIEANECLKEMNYSENLEEYTFYYTLNGIDQIVKWNMIIKMADTDIIPDQSFRPWRFSERKQMRKNSIDKYWFNRIGNMDVAEWHLLMYEE